MSYTTYRNNLALSRTKIYCPNCSEIMIAKKYLKHRKLVHDPDFNARMQCGFCSNVRWKYGEKATHSKHLVQCLNIFLRNQAVQKLKTPVKPVVEPYVPCDCQSFVPDHRWTEEQHSNAGGFYERIDLGDVPDWLRMRETPMDVYEAIQQAVQDSSHSFETQIPTKDVCCDEEGEDLKLFPKKSYRALNELSYERLLVLMNTLEFDEKTGLGEAASWIRSYTRFADSFHWVHAIVRLGTFKNFQEKLLQNSDNVYILPYDCICDGHSTDCEDPRIIWHRHMILVVRDMQQFLQAWQQVEFDGELRGKKRGMFKRIMSTLHLINTIHYVSHSKSQAREGYHWNLRNPMILHAREWIVLLVPGLVDVYLKIYNQHKNVGDISTKFRIRRRWYADASEMTGIKNCLLLFKSSLSIDRESGGQGHLADHVVDHDGCLKQYIFWMEDRFYFTKEGPRSHLFNLNEDSKLNSFHMAKMQQIILNNIKRNVETRDEKISFLEYQLESERIKIKYLEDKIVDLEETIVDLKEKIVDWEKKYVVLMD